MKNGKPTRVPKPWGHELIWALVPGRFAGKLLVIEKGHRLSLQYHRRKHESVFVLDGRLTLTLNKRTITVGKGKAYEIPPKTVHRFAARHGRVTLLEVSTTELDDVVRISDDYGRTGG